MAGRASVALPALSLRAAVRRPWVRFLPPALRRPSWDFIGRQLDVDGDDLADYAVRFATRHDHLAEQRRLYGFRSFSGGAARERNRAQSSEDLVRRFVEACRGT